MRKKKRKGVGDDTPAPKRLLSLSPAQQVALVRKRLGHLTMMAPIRFWLDTGSRRLNAVLGSEEKGLPYGKMFEFVGLDSHGKTLLALMLGGLAQAEDAFVFLVDFEGSHDEMWAERQGIDLEKLTVFQPEIVVEGKTERLQTAEEVCEEVEAWMRMLHQENPNAKFYGIVDSVATMVTDTEADGGITGQNMRTNSSLSMFLSKLLRRWAGLCRTHNAIIVFINQIRTKPGVMFGDPEYSPGGRALKHAASVRVRVQRVKGGMLKQNGKNVGIMAIITNKKNKAGEGSVEGLKCGFKAMFFKKDVAEAWKFLDAEKLKKEAKQAAGEE
jgi:recombination protein RecA